MNDEHPFLSLEPLINWSKLTASHAESDIDYAIELAKQRLDKIINLKDEEINYDSVFAPFDTFNIELQVGFLRLSHLNSVHETDELRASYVKCVPKEAEFSSSILLNTNLWKVIKRAAEKSDHENLSDEQRRFIQLTVEEFMDNGADLPEDKKQRVSAINVELSKLCKNFQDNVKDSTNKGELYVTNESDLKGLPSSAIEAAKEDATSKGHPDQWRFNLQYPSRLPIIKYLDNDEIRHKMYELGLTIGRGGDYDNTENIKKITALRDEKAQILGYKTFADFATARRMAQNGSNALKFVENLHDKVYKQFIEDIETLKKYVHLKDPKIELKPWNFSYWSEKQRKEQYDFDEEELKPYFSTQKVLDGLFKIVQKIYNIEVRQRETFVPSEDDKNDHEGQVEVWQKDVMYFEVYDIETKKLLGGFYADLFPREDKREGGWMSQISYGDIDKGIPNIVVLNTNLNKPIGDKPALLSHDDVSTLFHEFGHCLHGMLYTGQIKTLGGTNVPWDFVELPSQFHENYVWEREALDLFASHYQTKEKIPESLFKKMIAARNYQSAIFFIRQLYFGRIDLALHQEYSKYKEMEPNEVDNIVSETYRIPFNEPHYTRYNDITHLFADPMGYAAGYYSYKWAEVLDADCFSRFQKEGILNPKTGMSFRKEILERGNTLPVQDEFRNFMGRDPSQEALLKRSGIKV